MPKSRSRARGRSSERIARGILKRLGYKILETNKKVLIEGAEAFEVDMIALNPEGEKYCVEVKAGTAAVSDIRDSYANSEVLGLRPLIICKGLADSAAEAVAKELKVDVISLRDYHVLLEAEELEIIVRDAVRGILNEYGFYPLPPWERLLDKDIKLVTSLAEADDFKEAAESLGLDVDELGKNVGRLREKGILPRQERSFKALKAFSQQLLNRLTLIRRLDRIEGRVKRIEKALATKKGRADPLRE